MSTCREKIISVLSRGGRWTNVQIADVFMNEFQEPNMNNTIAKYLSFLIKDGMVRSDRVPGKPYNDYELITEKSKEDDLIDKIREAIKDHPQDHIEYKKAMLQIEQLEARKIRVA